MTDRELLELAAKAAGIKWYGFFGDYHTECLFLDIGVDENVAWNPLTNDADAFQLMVKLGLLYDDTLFHYISLERFKTKDVDDATAIRRGIVRAAAEDGRNMKEMWTALEQYQPCADAVGHGDSWKRMTTERTVDAARSAWQDAGGVADLAQYSNYQDAADAAHEAAWCAWSAVRDSAVALAGARAEMKYSAARAAQYINKAMKVQP